ncbi:YidH family protein [Nocardia bovistercoris]|uniref:DUF202 domain-containing protein n=1 Tax=Nocardia bovistercoris TaxID=2785916 RepID=A0A931N2C5_9NOCA|nr:DUF202 domain-containing protein [Nocardia bovistercoris]MBH0775373.1 DUF202 domain-containing protein [Nocardia bovistercoris]
MTLPTPGAESDDGEEDIDYRFTLANERTFLAWMRTSLGLLAGGVAVETLVQPFHMAGLRRAVSMSCLVLAVVVAVGAYLHWRRVRAAMYSGESLPGTLLVPILSVGVTVVAVLACAAVLLR